MASTTDTTFSQGRKETSFYVQVTRSNTSNTASGVVIPAGFVPTGVRVSSPTASNAGTSATISVGSTNSTTGVFVSALDVKGNAGIGVAYPSTVAAASVALPADTPITVQYAEGGTASTAGGPWDVAIQGLLK